MRAFAFGSFEGGDPRELRRWALAAAFVICGHAALVGGYLLWRQQPDAIGEDLPIVSVELMPIEGVADAKVRDVAPASQPMVEEKAIPPQPEKKPEQPRVEPLQPPDIVTSDVALPQARPPERVEAQRPPAPFTAAPVKGGAPRVEPSWETLLVRRLEQFKRYPRKAREHSEQGVAVLAFSVDRDGRVLSRRIARSSGHADLDNEVMAMIERAEPLPPFPPSMTQAQLNLTVPIRFSLR